MPESVMPITQVEPPTPTAVAELRMRQIVVGQWVNTFQGGESFSIIGLGEDGKVYRYDIGREGWVAWNMNEIPPRPRKTKEAKS